MKYADDDDEIVPELYDSASDSSLSASDSDTGSSDRSFDRGATLFARDDEERRSRSDRSGSRIRGSDLTPSRSGSPARATSIGTSRGRLARNAVESKAPRTESTALFGFEQGVLAGILSPKPEQCHQRFELGIDDLTFIGHPVCAGPDGRWGDTGPASNVGASQFNLVMVLEKPDTQNLVPGMSATEWTNSYYALVFKVSAVLYAEQVRARYVSTHITMLNKLRDECAQQGGTHRDFLRAAVAQSSLAETIYRIQRAIGRARDEVITINGHVDLHLQLPPLLLDPARALRLPEVQHVLDPIDPLIMRGDAPEPSQPDLSTIAFQEWTNVIGPFLLPWHTLLLPEGFRDQDGPNASLYALTRPFADLCEPTLQGSRTFAQAAEQLGWDLYERVYPMARHLIYYGKARATDVPRIQALYALDPTIDLADLESLSQRWQSEFPVMRGLPQFMADVSSSVRPFVSHFLPRTNPQLVLDVLLWLLRRRIVVQMHVHLRLVATERDQERAVELYRRHEEKRRTRDASDSDSDDALQRLIETLRIKQPQSMAARTLRSHERSPSQSSGFSSPDEFASDGKPPLPPLKDADDDTGDIGELIPAGAPCATFIPEPSRASRIENEWIAAMLDGKHPWYTRWFLRCVAANRLLPYLNGKHTLDEIVARERIRRRDLRLVLAQFEHNVVRFVHP